MLNLLTNKIWKILFYSWHTIEKFTNRKVWTIKKIREIAHGVLGAAKLILLESGLPCYYIKKRTEPRIKCWFRWRINARWPRLWHMALAYYSCPLRVSDRSREVRRKRKRNLWDYRRVRRPRSWNRRRAITRARLVRQLGLSN